MVILSRRRWFIAFMLIGIYCAARIFMEHFSLNSDERQEKLSNEERRKQWDYYASLSKNKKKVQRFPDVVGIGVKKCGTDAVISFLRLHPFVKTPANVETFFFNHQYRKGMEYYRKLMPHVADHELVMEKTPAYFNSPPISLSNRIHNELPAAKIILNLCDPVKRSFSDYTHERARFSISPRNNVVAKYKTFDSYLDNYLSKFNALTVQNKNEVFSESMRTYNTDHAFTILTTGLYSVFLPRWRALFDHSKLLLVNGEDMLNNPGIQVEQMQDFLGIPKLLWKEDFVRNPTTGLFCVRPWWKIYNYEAERKGVPGWEKSLICLGDTKGRTRHKHGAFNATQQHIEKLKKLYEPFNRELYQMTGIDFP